MAAPDNNHLLTGGLIKPILVLSLPTIAGGILQSLFNVVDIYFVGWVGTGAIAAVSIAGNAMWIIMTALIGLSIGSTALIARYAGANDEDQLRRAITTTLVAAFVVTIFLAIAAFTLGRPILRLLGAEPAVEDMAYGYLVITLGGGFAMIFSFMINGILRGTGDAMTPMIVLIIGTVINAILDPLLIAGIWIFPEWGVYGAAAATVLSRTVTVVIASVILFKRHLPFNLHVLKNFSVKMLGRIFTIGYPSTISGLVRSSAAFILIGLVAIYGTEAVAAYGIGSRLVHFILMPGFGFAAAAAILVGQNLGAGQPERAEKTSYVTIGIYAILAAVMIAVFVAAPRFWISLFDDTPDVITHGALYIVIVAPAFMFTTVGLTLSRAMSGAGVTLPPMLISASVLLGIRVPMALFFIYVLKTGVEGIFWANAIPMAIEAAAMFVLFKTGIWKRKPL
ncbi:MAG: MATE family efflux transporter [bacterium]|nr:MATE family efflux transporter [bacterium]